MNEEATAIVGSDRLVQAKDEVTKQASVRRMLLARLREPLSSSALVDAWLAGLRAAGIDAARARQPGSKWGTLEFVIEFPCLLDHRTDDRSTRSKTALVVEDDGWVSEFESSCERCYENWALTALATCPPCEADVDSDDHPADHEPLFLFSPGEGDQSPLAYVLWEFRRLKALASARWIIAMDGQYIGAFGPEKELALAHQTLARFANPMPSTVPGKRTRAKAVGSSKGKGSKVLVVRESEPVPERQQFTDAEVLALLEENSIPFTIGTKAIWTALVAAIPDEMKRPPRTQIERMKREAKASS